MNAIVLADTNWGIARNGKQICYISQDLNFFKEYTLGKTIIFGRKTLESFPNGKPLPGRTNICLSKTLSAKDDLIIKHSVEELNPEAMMDRNDVIIVGGACVYKQLYKYIRQIYVCRLHGNFDADRFFPAVDCDPTFDSFKLTNEAIDSTGLKYHYELYVRRHGSYV